MPPKKKGGKKQADDWEADLGETIDPIAQATADAKQAETEEDGAGENMNGGGGLLAALRKNKDKRAKKGKPVINDFVEGEDPDSIAPPPPPTDFDAKAPSEATFDDEKGEDTVFAGTTKKPKGGKKQQEAPADGAEDEDAEEGEGGGVKSKKEKEREKREREKQRKKEQVSRLVMLVAALLD
jgi:translation initiation factor 5B